MAAPYLVALGAAASFDKLRRAVAAACPNAEVHPAQSSRMRPGFPDTDNVVLVTTREGSNAQTASGASRRFGLVSHRHTPTAALRRMVRRLAGEFGSARLLVCQGSHAVQPFSLVLARTQTTTLAGFLRTGRVVQEDTLLSIVRPKHPCPTRRPREKPRWP